MRRTLTCFLHKIKHDRRGVAVELAITLLVVTVALSTLVLSTSLMQYTERVQLEKAMTQRIDLEQIGETFCAATAAGKNPEEWSIAYPEYKITVDGLTMTVYEPDSNIVLMTVELKYENEKYTVTQWNCN